MNNLVDMSFGKSVRMSVGSVPRISTAGWRSTGIWNFGRCSQLQFKFPGCFTPTQTQECLRRIDLKFSLLFIILWDNYAISLQVTGRGFLKFLNLRTSLHPEARGICGLWPWSGSLSWESDPRLCSKKGQNFSSSLRSFPSLLSLTGRILDFVLLFLFPPVFFISLLS